MNSINTPLDAYLAHHTRNGGHRGIARRARRLVAVDIENLVGGACRHQRQVEWAKSALNGALSLEPHDQVVVGLSHIGLLAVGCSWPRIRYVVRSGPDGADLALLDVLAENISARFDRVVIASGDGAFATAARALASAGVETTILARPGTVARSLRAVASNVLYVPAPPPEVEVAPSQPGGDSRPKEPVTLDTPDRHATPRAGTAPQSSEERRRNCRSRRGSHRRSRHAVTDRRRRSSAA